MAEVTVHQGAEEEVCATPTRRASATEDLLADSPTKYSYGSLKHFKVLFGAKRGPQSLRDPIK